MIELMPGCCVYHDVQLRERLHRTARHALLSHRRLDLTRHSLCAVDVTMSCIACLTSLTHLGLSHTYCSDTLAFNASLAGLASLAALRHLDLSHTEVDGSGLGKFCSSLQVCHGVLRYPDSMATCNTALSCTPRHMSRRAQCGYLPSVQLQQKLVAESPGVLFNLHGLAC